MTDPDEIASTPVAADVELRTRRWHGDGGVPVVLVHGLASNARLWDGVAGELTRRGHPVVAVDQRGHGRSSKPDPGPGGTGFDMVTVSDDLRALIGATGFDRPLVAGQSWGGNVVVELAARFPGLTRAVVGIDGGTIELAERFPDWDACAEALRPPPLAGTPRPELEAMLRRTHPDWPESGIQGTLACFEVRDDGTVAPWLTLDRHLAVLRGLWEHRPSERYGAIAEPVLLVGAASPGADPDWTEVKRQGLSRAASSLAHGRTEWMVGDHDLHAQHPRQVADLLHDLATEPSPT